MITLAQILTTTKFTKMDKMDLEGFDGIEGEGFIAELTAVGQYAIMDVTAETVVIQVYDDIGNTLTQWTLPNKGGKF